MESSSVASPQRTRPTTSPFIAGQRVIGLGLGTVAALALAGVVAFQLATWDRVMPGVDVLDVPLGGASRSDAAGRLGPAVDALLSRPLQLRHAEHVWPATVRELGVRLDPAGLAEAAYRVGRTGNPAERLVEQLEALSGGRSLAASSSVDQAALEAALRGLAREVEQPPRDARLALGPGGTVQVTAAQTGLAVDIPASRERVTQALADGQPSAELVVRELPPDVPDALVQPAREQLERLLGSAGAPLTLTFGARRWPLERATVLALLSLEGAAPGQPAVVRIDERPLRALAARLAEELDQTVREGRFQWSGGKLTVLRESREGRRLDQPATVVAIRDALLAGVRTVELLVAVTRPAVMSENPRALGIAERIEQARTPFAGSVPAKQANIRLAAERLNGVVVPPGATFSFNKELGPTTLDAGWQVGWGIVASGDGPARTVPTVAGGISQVVTTLFQAVFWAGYQVEERNPHSYWIPAYVSRGLEGVHATADEAAGLDLKWVNNSETPVLIQAWVDAELGINFALYGTRPPWTVVVDPQIKTDIVPADPTPVEEPEPTLPRGQRLQVEAARDGFTVTVVRRVIQNGQERVLRLTTRHLPSRNVTKVGTGGEPVPPADAPPPDTPPDTPPPEADTPN